MVMNARIEVNPQIHHGRPVIRGTRVPVVRILGCLAEGMTHADTAAAYAVSVDDVVAALDYAAELVEQAKEKAVATHHA